MNTKLTAALLLGLLTTTQVHASCLNPNADSRLRTYCVGESIVSTRFNVSDDDSWYTAA